MRKTATQQRAKLGRLQFRSSDPADLTGGEPKWVKVGIGTGHNYVVP